MNSVGTTPPRYTLGLNAYHAGASACLLRDGGLCGDEGKKLSEAPITAFVITDTIPLPPEKQFPKIKVRTVAPMLAEAIKRIHHDQSISMMFEKTEE